MRDLRVEPGEEVEQLEGLFQVLGAGGDGEAEAAGKAGVLVHRAAEPPGREAEVQVLVVAGKCAQVPVAADHHGEAAGAERVEAGDGWPAGAELGGHVDAADGVDAVVLPLHRLDEQGVVHPGGALVLHELGAVGPGVDVVAAVAVAEHLAGDEAHDLDGAVVVGLGQLLREPDHGLPVLRGRGIVGFQTVFGEDVLVPDDETAVGVEGDGVDFAVPDAFGPGGGEVVVGVDVVLGNEVVEQGSAAASGPTGHAEAVLAGDVWGGAASAGGHELGRHFTPLEGDELDRDAGHHLLVLLDPFFGPVGRAFGPELKIHGLHGLVGCGAGVGPFHSGGGRYTGCGQSGAESAGRVLEEPASRECACLHGNRSLLNR